MNKEMFQTGYFHHKVGTLELVYCGPASLKLEMLKLQFSVKKPKKPSLVDKWKLIVKIEQKQIKRMEKQVE